MKASCPREGLLSACQLASAAIPTREVRPILKNIKAVAASDRFTLMATDLEIGIRLDVRGLTVLEAGDAILPAAKLIAILRETRDDELEISADTSSCEVQGASSYFNLPSEDPAQFPDWPSFTEEKYHETTAGVLREMIRRVLFAAADDATRYSMTGVLWEFDGETIRLVATDGRRLALAAGQATPHGGHATAGQTPVVPTKAMSLLERNLMDDPDAVVKISIRPNDVLFRTERATIYSRLVEGRFPDYRAVLPKKHTSKATLPGAAFQAAVRQAAIMADEDTRRVAFKFEKGSLTLEAQGPTSGRSKVELAIAYEGKPVTINFNPVFVIDVLKVLPLDAEPILELTDAAAPALFRCGPDYQYLVMPLT
jgi:DNA polymerase-3 subunit beta